MNGQVPFIETATEADTRIALVVTGMHRSGTSAATRVMSLLGAELPRNLMCPGDDNPKGFWESDIVVRLNDELLAEQGSAWDDALALLIRRGALALNEATLLRMRRVLVSDFGSVSPVIMKDPRLAVLLDPWLAALKRSRYTPRLVIVVRDPLEVAASLAARNRFSTGRSLLLWLSYFLAVEKSSRGVPRAFVQYNDLLQDWRSAMRRVESALDVQFPRWTPAVELEVDGFLSDEDRHHRAPATLLAERSDVAEWVKTAFSWAQRASRSAHGPDTSQLDEVAEGYVASLSVFAPLIAEQRTSIRDLEAGSAALRETQAAEAAARSQDLEHGIAERDSHVAAASVRIAQLERELADRNTQAAEMQALARDQHARARTIEEQLRNYAGHNADLETALRAQRALAQDVQQREEGLIEQLHDKDARVATLEGEARESRAQTAGLEVGVEANARKLQERDAYIEHLKAETEAKETAARAMIETTRRAYQQSTSWKLTAPIRWVGGLAKDARFLVSNASSIAQLNGGVSNTVARARDLYQREGLSGLTRRVGNMIERTTTLEADAVSSQLAILERSRPLDVTVAEWQSSQSRLARLDRQQLTRRLLESGAATIWVSFTHDNYAANFGGIQLCAQIEQHVANDRREIYLNLHPAQPLPVLARTERLDEYRFGVCLNGELLGEASADAVRESVAEVHAAGRSLSAIIHSMLGHAPEIVAEIVRAGGDQPARFWLHDYLSLCPNYNLLRNDVKYCGAPDVRSNACGICNYGAERTRHLERMSRFFETTNVRVLSPSEHALGLWRERFRSNLDAIVVPHVRIAQTTVAPNVNDPEAPARIAYLGLPSHHKGWSAFKRLASEYGDHGKYRFYHFGQVNGGLDNVRFVSVRVGAQNRDAMTEALLRHQIDIALIWSKWPETFCFTMYEALAAGAVILTNPDSGNVQATVQETGRGMVLRDEDALLDAFGGGNIVGYIKRIRSSDRRVSKLEYSNMSFALDGERRP